MSRRIPIKKTNRKVPRSRHIAFTDRFKPGHTERFKEYFGYPLVTDLSVGLDNPLDVAFSGTVRPWPITLKGNWLAPKQPLHKRLTKLFKRRR
jgi:hypothetical protein